MELRWGGRARAQLRALRYLPKPRLISMFGRSQLVQRSKPGGCSDRLVLPTSQRWKLTGGGGGVTGEGLWRDLHLTFTLTCSGLAANT